MVFLFQKKARKAATTITDTIAHSIAGRIVRTQSKITAPLQRLERRCSIAQKKVLLILFCLVCGSYCFYLLARGLFGETNTNWSQGSQLQPPFQTHTVPADSVAFVK